jgi:ribose transport system permease protein
MTAALEGQLGEQPSLWNLVDPRRVERRYAAIWVALAAVLVLCVIAVPDAVNGISWRAVLPLSSFVAIAAIGQALVVRTGGIDLSAPSVMGVVALLLRTVGGGIDGSDRQLVTAIAVGLLISVVIGFANGVLVAIAGVSPLIATLATGAIVAGGSAWYEETHKKQTSVPARLSDFGTTSWLGINTAVYVALLIAIVSAFVLSNTVAGRRFTAAGTNPRAARIAGIPVTGHTIIAYTVAGLLFGLTGMLLGGFLGTPTLSMGAPYLLTPIVAVVLAGTALSGGSGSMLSIVGAAVFLRLLRHVLQTWGLPTSAASIAEGAFVIVGMAIASVGSNAPAIEACRTFVRRLLPRPVTDPYPSTNP